jgi:hypothetical protein
MIQHAALPALVGRRYTWGELMLDVRYWMLDMKEIRCDE